MADIQILPVLNERIQRGSFQRKRGSGAEVTRFDSGKAQRIKTEQTPVNTDTITVWMNDLQYSEFVDWYANTVRSVRSFEFNPIGYPGRTADGYFVEDPIENPLTTSGDYWAVQLKIEWVLNELLGDVDLVFRRSRNLSFFAEEQQIAI